MAPGAALLLLTITTLLAACADYRYTFNERVVYEPPPLLRDAAVDDPALASCLLQTFEDQRITAAGELRELRCSSAGIESLAGLQRYRGLARLNLDRNRLHDVEPLAALPALEAVSLRENHLQRLGAMACPPRLQRIALAGNEQLDCRELDALRRCGVDIVDGPAHCGA
jgi:Leucine-rich repeat (LRR) protein